jgi:hypothetical protein
VDYYAIFPNFTHGSCINIHNQEGRKNRRAGIFPSRPENLGASPLCGDRAFRSNLFCGRAAKKDFRCNPLRMGAKGLFRCHTNSWAARPFFLGGACRVFAE